MRDYSERHHTRHLPRYLAAACAILIVLVCLNPFTGWRDIGANPFDFLSAPLPRYLTLIDVVLNLLGFLPLGFLVAAALREHCGLVRTVVFTTLGCALLSFSVEFIQNYLPTRVASNVDLATNTLGALCGALAGHHWGRIFDERGALQVWRRRRVLPGHIGEIGLVLVGLWWLTLLEPGTMLFGSGDLRPWFDLPPPLAFSVHRYVALEALMVASQLVAVGLVVRRIMRAPSFPLFLLVLLIGVAVRSLACAVFVMPPAPWMWLTPGAVRGCVLGVLALLVMWRLPGWLQHTLACLALLATTALVNLAPDNPYIEFSSHLLQEGHALNFDGLTRLVASLWPFLALAFLSVRLLLVREAAAGFSRSDRTP